MEDVLRRLEAGRLIKRERMYRAKAARRLDDPAAVDDAVQELLLRDWERRDKITDDKHRFVRCWNLWLSAEIRRREKRQRERESVEAYGQLKAARVPTIHKDAKGDPVPVSGNGLLARNPATPRRYAPTI